MELVAISREDAICETMAQLGVQAEDGRLSTEVIAAALRRAASLICPTTPLNLVSAVDQSLASLFPEEDRRQRCRDSLDDLIALGDLMEYEGVEESAESSGKKRLIYAAPPYFVEFSDSRVLILGIALDAVDPVPDGLPVSMSGHIRSIRTQDMASTRKSLLHAGFHEVKYAAWAKAPKEEPADAVVSGFDELLNLEGGCGSIPGLRVIDGSIVTRRYKQRWVAPRGLTGRFVGTRPQKYGADLWCYVELGDGEPIKLVDLPQGRTLERGCDQAWRLQCALDAVQGRTQTFETLAIEGDGVQLSVHMPCPNWLQRRWDCVGQRVGSGAFSYLFESRDLASEQALLEKYLWMRSE